jgi:hypothetical protein
VVYLPQPPGAFHFPEVVIEYTKFEIYPACLCLFCHLLPPESTIELEVPFLMDTYRWKWSGLVYQWLAFHPMESIEEA